MAAPIGSQRLGTASVWQDQTAASSLQRKWCSRTCLVLYKFIDCGFLISKWQGTASSWQGLGPAWPALGYATAHLCVDKIVTGCDSEEDAIQYCNTACWNMKEAQLNLRSWASNNRKLINLAVQDKQDKIDDGNRTVNVWGIQWDTQTDTVAESFLTA